MALGLLIALTVYGLLTLSTSGVAAVTWFYLLGAAAVMIASVLCLGITATFISIHDHHAELVDELRALREHIVSSGDGR